MLNDTKGRVDEIVNDNKGVIENEGYFKREVMKSLISSASKAQIDIKRDARVEATNLLVMLYLRDLHEGED